MTVSIKTAGVLTAKFMEAGECPHVGTTHGGEGQLNPHELILEIPHLKRQTAAPVTIQYTFPNGLSEILPKVR